MKKVLITGAAGTIGLNLIKYLLSEGKYEITALDLKNKRVYKRLRKYRNRVNIVYGDILDQALVDLLVKENDIVIHLASCLPPLSEYKKDLVNIIDYNGTENIVKAINYYNPNCLLIYASSTSLYGNASGNVKNKIKLDEDNYYNNAKLKAENLIIKKVSKYVIARFSLVLGDLRNDAFIYNIKKNSLVECITKEDAAYAIVSIIKNKDKVNKKILNIGGGESCTTTYKELLKNILKYHGLSFNYLVSFTFGIKNFTSYPLEDSDDSNKKLNYRNDSLSSYYMRQKRRSKLRKTQILLAKPFILFLNKKKS